MIETQHVQGFPLKTYLHIWSVAIFGTLFLPLLALQGAECVIVEQLFEFIQPPPTM